MENELETKTLTMQEKGEKLIVNDFKSCEIAAEFIKTLKPLRAEIENTFNPIISKAHAAHKEACEQKNKFLKPIDALEKSIRDKIGAYNAEEDKKRRAEEKRILEELELKAKLEREAAALKAIEEDKPEEAEVIMEKPIIQPAPVEYKQPKPVFQNSVSIDCWKFEIIDAASVPREYCFPDEKMIGAIVKANKGKITIPGVRVYNEPITRIK
jgi:hypothetical protein